MRMRMVATGAALAVVSAVTVVNAHMKNHELPAGPIRDRHELMDGIGKNAKIIGDALKSGDPSPVGAAAEKIHSSAGKILSLFPEGSTHPKSRAKPEIWTNWAKFAETSKKLEADAGALAAAAKSGGDVKGAADSMFGACKSCHDDFRVPEKKKSK